MGILEAKVFLNSIVRTGTLALVIDKIDVNSYIWIVIIEIVIAWQIINLDKMLFLWDVFQSKHFFRFRYFFI